MATYVGLITAFGAFAYGAFIVVRTLLFGNPVAGYPSLLTVILFLGGVQLTAIGVLGEYIGRIFNETKHRPLYFINAYQSTRNVNVVQGARTGWRSATPALRSLVDSDTRTM
jgi:hypothetical protein